MTGKGDAAKALSRHLHDAIERVREDVAKVEFWADAMTGFSQPVPDYESDEAKVWLPSEQGTALPAHGRADDGGTPAANPDEPNPRRR